MEKEIILILMIMFGISFSVIGDLTWKRCFRYRHMMDYRINVFIIISNSHYWGEISNRLI